MAMTAVSAPKTKVDKGGALDKAAQIAGLAASAASMYDKFSNDTVKGSFDPDLFKKRMAENQKVMNQQTADVGQLAMKKLSEMGGMFGKGPR